MSKIQISHKVRELKPSAIRRFFGLVDSMPNAISLSIGEPDFVTPWLIRESGIFSLEKGRTHYTANLGMIELRKEIANYLKRRFGVNYDPIKEIMVTVGVSEGLDLAMRTIVNEGDNIIVPQPSFVAYPATIFLAGGNPIPFPTYVENEFKIDIDEFERVIKENNAKAAVLGFPNNPTGAVMERYELEKIADIAKRYGVTIITDEIYAELVYGDHSPISFAAIPGVHDQTILLGGFSKAYAMTGWRLGYVAAPAYVIENMNKIHSYTCMCASTPAQTAAIEALKNGDKEVEKMRSEYDRRRRYILSRFDKMDLPCFEPRGAFYLFPSIAHTGISSLEFAERLLMEYEVAVVPGSAFGECGEGYIRCCYATSMENIKIALERIETFLNSMKK